MDWMALLEVKRVHIAFHSGQERNGLTDVFLRRQSGQAPNFLISAAPSLACWQRGPVRPLLVETEEPASFWMGAEAGGSPCWAGEGEAAGAGAGDEAGGEAGVVAVAVAAAAVVVGVEDGAGGRTGDVRVWMGEAGGEAEALP
jgi:hypothetical protein